MKIATSNNMISFCSKINFVSEKEFYDQKDRIQHCDGASREATTVYMDEPLKINNGLFTIGANTCTAGGFTNGKKGAMFHCNSMYYDDSLKNAVNELKDNDKQLNGLLVGSERDGIKEYFDNFINIFKNLSVKTSIFRGQNNWGGTSIVFSADDDTWYLYACERPVRSKPVVVDSVEKLKNFYEEIKVSDEDELWINGKKIDVDKEGLRNKTSNKAK